MPQFHCKFNLGDRVVKKVDVERFAFGGPEPIIHDVQQVEFSTNKEPYIRCRGVAADFERNYLFTHEIKDYSLSFLSGRISAMANLSDKQINSEGGE